METSERVFAAAKAGDTKELRRLVAEEGAAEVLNVGNKERYGCKPLHYGLRPTFAHSHSGASFAAPPAQHTSHRMLYRTPAREPAAHGCRGIDFREAPTSSCVLPVELSRRAKERWDLASSGCNLQTLHTENPWTLGVCFSGGFELLHAGQTRGRGEFLFEAALRLRGLVATMQRTPQVSQIVDELHVATQTLHFRISQHKQR